MRAQRVHDRHQGQRAGSLHAGIKLGRTETRAGRQRRGGQGGRYRRLAALRQRERR
jgi:hypothetical protein